MTLILKKLTIENFKGIKYLEIDFGEKKTKICGKNAIGKTTIADAYCWLLFDKNSIGEKEFNLKPIENGEDLHKIMTKVEGIFCLEDNNILKLAKTWEEKWIVHTGEAIEKFEGHTGSYYINDIKVTAKEYKEKVSSICKEQLFDILTTPFGFANLDWKKRREILFDLTNAKKIEEEILEKYDDLAKEIKSVGKDGLKALIKQKINLLNKEKEKLEIRIEEAKKETINETEIKEKETLLLEKKNNISFELEKLQNEIKTIEEKIKQENEAYFNYINTKTTLETEIKELENKIKQTKEKQEKAKEELKKTITLKQEEKNILEKELSLVKEEIFKLIEEQKKGFEINEEDKFCKFCRQPLPSILLNEKIKEREQTFFCNIKLKIQQLKNKSERLQEEINSLQTEIETLEKIHPENTLTKDIELLEKKKEELNTITPIQKKDVSTINIEKERAALYEQKEKIEIELSLLEEAKKKIAYVKKLTQEHNEQCKEILKLKSKLLTIEKLEQEIANTIEEKVNKLFENDQIPIKIKMFNRLINEGIEPNCEILVGSNLIPFFNANRGLQINSGCLIANKLAYKYNTYLPLFIDNAEAVNKIVDTTLQMILLYVTEDEKITIYYG